MSEPTTDPHPDKTRIEFEYGTDVYAAWKDIRASLEAGWRVAESWCLYGQSVPHTWKWMREQFGDSLDSATVLVPARVPDAGFVGEIPTVELVADTGDVWPTTGPIRGASYCPSCGAGYRYGDDGCQHRPAAASPVTPEATPVDLEREIAHALTDSGSYFEAAGVDVVTVSAAARIGARAVEAALAARDADHADALALERATYASGTITLGVGPEGCQPGEWDCEDYFDADGNQLPDVKRCSHITDDVWDADRLVELITEADRLAALAPAVESEAAELRAERDNARGEVRQLRDQLAAAELVCNIFGMLGDSTLFDDGDRAKAIDQAWWDWADLPGWRAHEVPDEDIASLAARRMARLARKRGKS